MSKRREKKQSSQYIISLPSSRQSGAGAKVAGLRSISRAPSFQRVGQAAGALAVTNTIYCTWGGRGGQNHFPGSSDHTEECRPREKRLNLWRPCGLGDETARHGARPRPGISWSSPQLRFTVQRQITFQKTQLGK